MKQVVEEYGDCLATNLMKVRKVRTRVTDKK